MGIFKAAAIQMRSGTDPRRNAADFEALVREAAGKGATYVQTPEMTGAIVRDKDARALAFKSEEKDEIVAAAARLSAELGIFLHVGSTAILRADGKIANRALLFAPDGSLAAPTTKSTCSTSTSTMAPTPSFETKFRNHSAPVPVFDAAPVGVQQQLAQRVVLVVERELARPPRCGRRASRRRRRG